MAIWWGGEQLLTLYYRIRLREMNIIFAQTSVCIMYFTARVRVCVCVRAHVCVCVCLCVCFSYAETTWTMRKYAYV